MFLRNLMAMDTEEMIRAQPMDAVVLIGGCDKTLPAQIMAAVSARPADDRAAGRPDGGRPSQGRGARRLHRLPPAVGDIPRRRDRRPRSRRSTERLAPSVGTCMVMGTASTMACITEALGLTLPRAATIPRLMPSASGSPRPAAGAPPPWRSRDGPKPERDHHAGRVPQRAGGAAGDRRLDQRHDPPDRHRRPHGHRLDLEDFDRIWAARCRCWSISSRRASTTWSISIMPAACRADGRARRAASTSAPTVTGGDAARHRRAPPRLPGQDAIRPLGRPPIKPRRDGRAARQSRAPTAR